MINSINAVESLLFNPLFYLVEIIAPQQYIDSYNPQIGFSTNFWLQLFKPKRMYNVTLHGRAL